MKLDKLLLLALILFTTPSYSIIYYVTGKYVPNHIFGYLIILAIVLSKKSITIDPLKLLLSLILIIYIFLICTYNGFLNTTTLHFIFIILCLALINKEIKISSNLLKSIVFIQFLLAVTQTMLMNIGLEDIVHSFKTYPSQTKDNAHLIQNWFWGFYRVGGGFKESSQFAAFMVICLFLNEKCKTTKLLGTIGILITGSMLGFIGLIIFSLIKVKNYLYKTIIASVCIILAIPLMIWRITYSKLFNVENEEMGSDRFYNLYLSMTGNNFSYFGNGLDYYRGNDFLSIYMPSVGIVGVCLIVLYLCCYFAIMKKYSGLIFTFLIFLCINGSIQEVPYQFLFLMISAQLFIHNKRKFCIYENY